MVSSSGYVTSSTLAKNNYFKIANIDLSFPTIQKADTWTNVGTIADASNRPETNVLTNAIVRGNSCSIDLEISPNGTVRMRLAVTASNPASIAGRIMIVVPYF